MIVMLHERLGSVSLTDRHIGASACSAYMSQTMANHSSPRTTKAYDRRQDDISLDEVERIVI